MKIPKLVWIGGAIAAGAYLISKSFGSTDLAVGGTPGIKGTPGVKTMRVPPKLGPGLYASWIEAGSWWAVYDGEMKAEQVRIKPVNAGAWSVTIDGEDILLVKPNGWKRKLRRQRSPGKSAPLFGTA